MSSKYKVSVLYIRADYFDDGICLLFEVWKETLMEIYQTNRASVSQHLSARAFLNVF